MENTILPLTGVARAKYVRDFTRKINSSHTIADIFAAKKSKKSQGVKKRRRIEPRITVRLQKKDMNQEYVVQRMRFLKQSIEIVNQAVNKQQPKIKMPSVSYPQQSKFDQFKNKSFEIEKQKLEEMYKVEMQNLNMSMEPINQTQDSKSKSPVLQAHPDEPEHVENASISNTAQSLINNSITLQDLQQGDECAHENPKVEFQDSIEVSENIEKNQEVIIEPAQLIQDDSQDKAIQLCQNQLQNINLDSNHCNALVPRPTNNMTTSRRICHRTKRFKRHSNACERRGSERNCANVKTTDYYFQVRPMKPICAHCHEHITEVAYFSGTQQLCYECADRHYERVSRARFQDRPMGYKEFKNVGGDTIYTNKN